MSEDKENQSEIARLRAQISAEYNAAQQGLTGYAEVSKHQFITAHMERMAAFHDRLKALVGDDEAAKMLAESMDKEAKDGKE